MHPETQVARKAWRECTKKKANQSDDGVSDVTRLAVILSKSCEQEWRDAKFEACRYSDISPVTCESFWHVWDSALISYEVKIVREARLDRAPYKFIGPAITTGAAKNPAR